MSTPKTNEVIVGALVEPHLLNQSYRSLIHTRNKISQRLTKDIPDTERMVLEALLSFVDRIMEGKSQKDVYSAIQSTVQILFDLESAHTMLVEGAHAQIQELFEEIQNNQLQSSPTQSIIDMINKEIIRRKAWDTAVRSMQERLENDITPKEDKVEELNILLSYKATDEPKEIRAEKERLEKEINTDTGVIRKIIEHIGNNNKKIGELQKYVDAYALLQKSPPLHLCGEKFESFDGIEKEYIDNAPQPE